MPTTGSDDRKNARSSRSAGGSKSLEQQIYEARIIHCAATSWIERIHTKNPEYLNEVGSSEGRKAILRQIDKWNQDKKRKPGDIRDIEKSSMDELSKLLAKQRKQQKELKDVFKIRRDAYLRRR